MLIFLMSCIFCFLRISSGTQDVLIITSFDAFRNEYFQRNVTDYMNSLRRNNTYSDNMENIFPTKTFPNHHSISTGVYAKDHGVLANGFYDLDLKKEIKYSFEMFHYKSEIHPIYTLNEKNGGTSGCMMWPGSNFPYEDISCTHIEQFNATLPFKARVDKILKWILDPKKPANLIMLYFEEPDTHGHAFSPESKVITDLVAQLNEITEYLHKKLEENNLLQRVTVVHLSDHGMDSIQTKNIIDLTTFVGNNSCNFYGTTPILQIVPKNEKELDNIYNSLVKASGTNQHFKIYKNSNLPERWNFRNKDRVGPLTAVAELKYGFQDMFQSIEFYKKTYNISITPEQHYGVHGYDNLEKTMKAMFFAYGNRVKQQNKVDPFNSVDLMYLFCEILGIEPPKYLSGNAEIAKSILKAERKPRFSRWVIMIGSLASSVVLVTFLAFAIRCIRRNQQHQVPNYLYETDTILEEPKTNYSINSHTTSMTSIINPSTSLHVA